MKLRRQKPAEVPPIAEPADPTFGEMVRLIPVAEPSDAAGPAGDDDSPAFADPSAAPESATEPAVPSIAEPAAAGAVSTAATVPGQPGPATATAPAPVPRTERPPTRLVIADDDLPDAVEISEIPLDGSGAVKVDPRIRRRRIDVQRAAGRRRLIVVLLIVFVFALIVAALAVLASPLFSVSKVEVSGAVYTTPEELAPIIDDAKGKAILTLDTDAIVARLEQLPWVRAARVESDFPSTLKIEIAERQAIAAFVGADAQWRVIDRDGRVIAVIPNGAQPAAYLPIDGTGPDAQPGVVAGDAYRVAGELALSLPAELRVVTAAITLGKDGSIGLRLTSGTAVDFGAPNDLRTKLAVLIQRLREVDPSTLASVNLTDPFNPGLVPKP